MWIKCGDELNPCLKNLHQIFFTNISQIFFHKISVFFKFHPHNDAPTGFSPTNTTLFTNIWRTVHWANSTVTYQLKKAFSLFFNKFECDNLIKSCTIGAKFGKNGGANFTPFCNYVWTQNTGPSLQRTWKRRNCVSSTLDWNSAYQKPFTRTQSDWLTSWTNGKPPRGTRAALIEVRWTGCGQEWRSISRRTRSIVE